MSHHQERRREQPARPETKQDLTANGQEAAPRLSRSSEAGAPSDQAIPVGRQVQTLPGERGKHSRCRQPI